MVVPLSSPLVARAGGLECRLHLVGGPVAPDQTTFVLVPGIGMSHRYLRRFAAALAPHGRVCSIDLPSFGANSTPAQFAVELAVRRPALGLAADSPLESPSANAIVFTGYWRSGPGWYSATLPAMFGYPIEHRIRLVEQPVLVLRGSRDPIARAAWCRELAGRARDGRLAEIEGQPHVVQHSAADQVAAEILAFLTAPVGLGA